MAGEGPGRRVVPTRLLSALVLLVAVTLALAACGGGHKSSGQARIRLTAHQVPDVLTPGIWEGITGVYRQGDEVTIYTNWQNKTDAEGACMAASGDLGYDVNVTVYGSVANTLASC
jgi:hypothetical protein